MLSEDKIKKMFKELAIIDQDAKTGKKDPLLALDQFIVSL
jgi:DNA polymerase III delta subunit